MKYWILCGFFIFLCIGAGYAEDAPPLNPDSSGQSATPDAWQGMSQFLLMMGSIFAIFYFLLIRPQQKQRQKHEERINQLKKGDKVVGAGGIYGTIIGVKDDKAVMKIGGDIKIEILKSTITHILGDEENK